MPISQRQLNRGKLYSKKERAKVLAFIAAFDKRHRYGGRSAASAKFGVTLMTIARWIAERTAGQATASVEERARTLMVLIVEKEAELKELQERFEAMLEAL